MPAAGFRKTLMPFASDFLGNLVMRKCSPLGLEERATSAPQLESSYWCLPSLPRYLQLLRSTSVCLFIPHFPLRCPRSLLGDCPSALPSTAVEEVPSANLYMWGLKLSLRFLPVFFTGVAYASGPKAAADSGQICCVSCWGFRNTLPWPVSRLLGVIPSAWHINPEYQHVTCVALANFTVKNHTGQSHALCCIPGAKCGL